MLSERKRDAFSWFLEKLVIIVGIVHQVVAGSIRLVSTYVTSFFLVKNYIILLSSGLY